jgi:hypothetical protein
MDRRTLEQMRLPALRLLALEAGIPGAATLSRAEIIERLATRSETDAAPRPPGGPKPARAGFDVPSSTVHPHAEELETLAMALRYVDEGQLGRGLEILDKLAKLDPTDSGVVGARDQVRRRIGDSASRPAVEAKKPEPSAAQTPSPGPAPAPPAEPFGMLDLEELPETYGVDECEVLYKDPQIVFTYWEVTEHGRRGAEAQLGQSASGARLVLRFFVTSIAASGEAVRDLRDIELDWNHGRRYVQVARAGAQLRVAVGLLSSEGYFAPIAHSSLIRLPPGGPSAEVATEWMEVVPAKGSGRKREAVVIVRRDPEHAERGPGGGEAPSGVGGSSRRPPRGGG